MVVGLTGGIGSGKSTIANELRKRGFAVYDCDREAKRLIAENKDIQAAIIRLLGPEAFRDVQRDNVLCTKEYNTAYVAKRVFAEPALLAALNNIVHPAVKEDILQRSGLSAKRSVSEAVCQQSGLSAKRSVSEAVCQRSGLSAKRSVSEAVCQRSGLSAKRSVSVAVCQRSGLSAKRSYSSNPPFSSKQGWILFAIRSSL